MLHISALENIFRVLLDLDSRLCGASPRSAKFPSFVPHSTSRLSSLSARLSVPHDLFFFFFFLLLIMLFYRDLLGILITLLNLLRRHLLRLDELERKPTSSASLWSRIINEAWNSFFDALLIHLDLCTASIKSIGMFPFRFFTILVMTTSGLLWRFNIAPTMLCVNLSSVIRKI